MPAFKLNLPAVRLYFILLFFLLFFSAFSQRDSVVMEDGTVLSNLPDSPPPKNALFIELGGNGGIYSLNYDRILTSAKKIRTSLRGGFSVLPVNRNIDLVFPIEFNFLLGSANHFMETGAGVTYVKSMINTDEGFGNLRYNYEQFLGVCRLGYRFQERLDRGLFFRAGITPYLFQTNEYDRIEPIFQFWLGVSAGANF